MKSYVILNLFLFFTHFYNQAQYFICPPNGQQYPIQMIDPKVHAPTEQQAIVQFFNENGYVVIDNVSETQHRVALVSLIDYRKRYSRGSSVGFFRFIS